MYRNYRLKLSSDPLGFPLKVPSHPDFSSDSCYVTVTSAAHLCGTKVTRHENLLPLSAISASLTIPSRCSPSPNEQGKRSYLRARVRVAQSRIIQKEWIEETVSSLSARHSRASEVSPARSFVEAVFWQKLSRAVQENSRGWRPLHFPNGEVVSP